MTFDLGPALLFCPADRPERFAKAQERADAVILDLEDAVLPEAKNEARENIVAADLDPARVIVRVNAPDSAAFADDLEALARSPFRTVMVAKTESAASLDAFDTGFTLLALCETARGIHAAPDIAAHPAVAGLMWGAEDLVASLGGTSSRNAEGGYRDIARYARSRVLLRPVRTARRRSTRCTSTSATPRGWSGRRRMRRRPGSARRRASIRVRSR